MKENPRWKLSQECGWGPEERRQTGRAKGRKLEIHLAVGKYGRQVLKRESGDALEYQDADAFPGQPGSSAEKKEAPECPSPAFHSLQAVRSRESLGQVEKPKAPTASLTRKIHPKTAHLCSSSRLISGQPLVLQDISTSCKTTQFLNPTSAKRSR